MKRVYFEVSGVFFEQWESKVDLIAKRLRTIGLDRILYGSDGPPLPNWRAFRRAPLTGEEFRKIERNITPLLEIAVRRGNPEIHLCRQLFVQAVRSFGVSRLLANPR